MSTNEVIRDAYLDAVAVHLGPIVGKLPWSIELGVCISKILQLHVIEFVDGFVANCEGDDPVRMIGVSEAAMVVARLAPEGLNDWKWWRGRSQTGVGLKFADDDLENLLGVIREHPSVRRID